MGKNPDDFWVAVVDGRVDDIVTLIRKGADVNTIFNDDEPILFTAIIKGNLEVVKILINAGSNVNCKVRGAPIVFEVLRLCQDSFTVEVLQILLNAGANTKIKFNGMSLIEKAVLNNNKIMAVEVILRSGVDPNSKIYHGMSLILSAILESNKPLVEVLIRCGANVNVVKKSFLLPAMYPLDHAIAQKDWEIASMLFKSGAKTSIENFDLRKLM